MSKLTKSSAAKKGQKPKPQRPTFRFDYDINSPPASWSSGVDDDVAEHFLEWAHRTGADVPCAIDLALYSLTQRTPQQRQQDLNKMQMRTLTDGDSAAAPAAKEQADQTSEKPKKAQLEFEADSPSEQFAGSVHPSLADVFMEWTHDNGLDLRAALDLAIYNVVQVGPSDRQRQSVAMRAFLDGDTDLTHG